MNRTSLHTFSPVAATTRRGQQGRARIVLLLLVTFLLGFGAGGIWLYLALRKDAPAEVDPEQSSGITPPPSSKHASMLDLTRLYNASLNECWHNPTKDDGNNLASLPVGFSTVGGTQFEIRGIIQLAGTEIIKRQTRYPTNVSGIQVSQKLRTLHFLHGVGWGETDGTLIADFVVHQADGQIHTVGVTYGQDVRGWQFWPEGEAQESGGAKPAWKGPQKRWEQFWPKWGVRLYKLTWINPRPDVEVQSIDLVSKMTRAAPFLIAITAEP